MEPKQKRQGSAASDWRTETRGRWERTALGEGRGFALPAPRQRRPHADVSQPASERAGDPLRRLREDRSARRGRRNLVMLVSGVVILLSIVLLFGTRRPKKRR